MHIKNILYVSKIYDPGFFVSCAKKCHKNFKMLFILLLIIIICLCNLICKHKNIKQMNSFEENINDKYDSKLLYNNKPLNIIYNVYINHNRDWKYIIDAQINDIKSSKILNISNIFIVVTDEKNIITREYFDKLLPNVKFQYFLYTKNTYEYYGIKTLHELANLNENKIYLYLHTKGMVYHDPQKLRNEHEQYLISNLLNNHMNAINLFNNNKNINKIGLFPSDGSFIWFNFFYVRGSYLKKCREPIITTKRHYYESYIGNEYLEESVNDSFSLFSNKIDKFDPHTTLQLMQTLIEQYKLL